MDFLAVPAGHIRERCGAEEVTHDIGGHVAINVRPPHSQHIPVDHKTYRYTAILKVIN
jgi:hypothetical protein